MLLLKRTPVADVEPEADEPQPEVAAVDPLLSELSSDVGAIGIELVDVAGAFEALGNRLVAQMQTFEALGEGSHAVARRNTEVAAAAASVGAEAHAARAESESSKETVEASLDAIRTLVESVRVVGARLSSVQGALDEIARVASSIDEIAKQTHLLALNARIEAARSSAEGSGFAVIAEEVRKLSDRTISSAADIDATLQTLSGEVSGLVERTTDAVQGAATVEASTSAIIGLIENVQVAMTTVDEQSATIARAASTTSEQVEEWMSSLDELTAGVEDSSAELGDARERVKLLLDAVEAVIQKIASSDVETVDTPFVAAAIASAAKVAALFESALASGAIAEHDLWDEDYRPVPGTNPAQVTTRFLGLTDRVLPGVQEPLLDWDERVAFTAAVDRNGYLPTHNVKFSKPQGPDPVWNNANCRNRRIFDDRTGLGAGRNTKPFLLQTYRRDMGGGTFVLMKDVSAPIVVRGRHWGGFRIGYRA